jgi:hypothetical protein
LFPNGSFAALMKKANSHSTSNATPLVPAQLRKQACRVFGGGTTVQLFGSGGRVLTSDGRRLEFADMTEWASLIERERPASKAPPSRAKQEVVVGNSKLTGSKPNRGAKQPSPNDGTQKKRSVRFIWEML